MNTKFDFGPDPEGTVYIDSRLDIENHMGDRSVVVHELVHHIQRMTLGSRADNCEEWARREQQAYGAQAVWLRSRGLRAGNLTLQARFLRCDRRSQADVRETFEPASDGTPLSTNSTD